MSEQDSPSTPPPEGAAAGDDNVTPTGSPRDLKRQRTVSEGSMESPRGERPIMVAASPPKYVSMEEIMSAAAGVSNMALAHEIAVDKDFKINPVDPPPNSVERQVKEVMHRAFWDSLQEKLSEDPPDTTHAVVLLQEVKQKLLELLLPQHQKLRQQIDEVLDMELIQQKADNEALDIHYYAGFVISLMAKLCAPARDEQIAKLTDIKDVVPLFKEVFSILDLMRVDMANFTIQQIRPYIQQQSAHYEKLKFDDFLKKQKENNLDGLQFTKAWLERNHLLLKAGEAPPPGPGSAPLSASAPPPRSASDQAGVSPVTLLNQAYLELLQWDFDHQIYPETVLMDESRLIRLSQQLKWLSLVSGVLLVTYNTVGGPLAGLKGFKTTLRDSMKAILAGVKESDLPEAMKNVSLQVVKDVQCVLAKHDFAALDSAHTELLTGQVQALTDDQHPVRKIMTSRMIGFLMQVLSNSKPQSVQIPPGLSAVSDELSEMTGGFLALINHNRAVFGPYYADIIKDILSRDREKREADEKSDNQ